jgi:hypothetical protein
MTDTDTDTESSPPAAAVVDSAPGVPPSVAGAGGGRPFYADPYFAAGVGVGLLVLFLLATRGGGCADCAERGRARRAAEAGEAEPVEAPRNYVVAEPVGRQAWAGCDVVEWCAGPRGHDGDHVRLRPLIPDESYTVDDAAADLVDA